MQKRLVAGGWTVMATLSVFVALFSPRFIAVPFGSWPAIDEGIRRVIMQIPFTALTHMLIAPLALLVGPLQFLAGFRARHRPVHRIIGRVYVAACVIAGIGGFATAFHASGGPVAGLGFGMLAVCWVGTTLGAWRAAVRRRLELHQLLMRLSYAMTFAAVTLRLQIPIGLLLGYPSYSAMSVWLAYTSWLPNVIIVGLCSLLLERSRKRATVPAHA
jgi:hypothetical protein